MRLRPRDLKTVYLKKRIVVTDDEGEETIEYDNDHPVELELNIQSGGGSVSAQKYGSSLDYMKSCKYQGNQLKPVENELDGLCVDVGPDKDPDYQIKTIQPFSTHMNIILERIDNNGSED